MKLVKCKCVEHPFICEIIEDLGESFKLRLLPEYRGVYKHCPDVFVIPKSWIDNVYYSFVDSSGVQMSLFD